MTTSHSVQSKIARAEAVPDPFVACPEKRIYRQGSVNVELVVHDSASLPEGTAEWAAQLVGDNLGSMYRDTWGWNFAEKLEDLKHPKAWHVLAREGDGSSGAVGYCHYRWEQDPLPEEVEDASEVVPIMYIYEVQLQPHVRGHGLASYMMRLLEVWAKEHGMAKIMLTCFQANTAALAMYRKLGYELDVSSPDPEVDGPETAGYDILCKWL